MIERGDIHWADLGPATGSGPAKRRPLLVIQADSFNASRIRTVVAAVVTSNPRLASAPGNVALPKRISKLPKDSVVNVSQIVTVDKDTLLEKVSSLPHDTVLEVAIGIRLALDL